MNSGFVSFISIGVATRKVFCGASDVLRSTGAADSSPSATRDLLFFYRSSRAPRRESQAAPGGTTVFCFGCAALRVLAPPGSGPLQESTPGHLGAAFPRVRSG